MYDSVMEEIHGNIWDQFDLKVKVRFAFIFVAELYIVLYSESTFTFLPFSQKGKKIRSFQRLKCIRSDL
jgi:hypothetical protein